MGVLSGALLCIVSPAYSIQTPAHAFEDVPAGDPAYTQMIFLQKQGDLSGYLSNYFTSGNIRTRYEVAVTLQRVIDHLCMPSSPPVKAETLTIVEKLADRFMSELELLGKSRQEVETELNHLSQPPVMPVPPESSIKAQGNLPAFQDVMVPMIAPLPSSFSRSAGSTISPISLMETMRMLQNGSLDPVSMSDTPSISSPMNIHLALPLAGLGQLGVSVQRSVQNSLAVPADVSSFIYGANLKLQPFTNLTFGAEAVKSLSNNVLPGSSGQLQSQAYRVNVGYENGPASATLGYQMISPQMSEGLYGLNSIQGPYTSLSLKLTGSLKSYVEGEYLSNVSPLSSVGNSYLNNIYRGRIGLLWNPTPGLHLSADYESVYYGMANSISQDGRMPIAQYLTLGAGLAFNNSAELKMAYQYGTDPLGGAGYITSSPTSIFTTQLSIHF